MNFSNEIINAYVDGELQGSEKESFELELKNDIELSSAVEDLMALKHQLQHAYGSLTAPQKVPVNTVKYKYAMYAAFLLITFSIGWVGGGMQSNSIHNIANNSVVLSMNKLNPDVIVHQPGKYILHIGHNGDANFKKTLDQAEALMLKYKNSGFNIELEIVANAGGLNLFVEGASPYTQRVKKLREDYPNIKFIACSNAIERLREKGIEPHLINSVHQGVAAIDQVVKRINQGWTYMKI